MTLANLYACSSAVLHYSHDRSLRQHRRNSFAQSVLAFVAADEYGRAGVARVGGRLGGAVWKTLTDKPTQNVTSRYGGIDLGNQRLMGLNNIELISDRPLEDNLREIAQVKKTFPDRALIASLMVESKRETWHEIVRRVEAAGVDGLELNFGCPHGMNNAGREALSARCRNMADDHRLGEGSFAPAGAGKADAERHRYHRHFAVSKPGPTAFRSLTR